jgi:hypothetical protein
MEEAEELAAHAPAVIIEYTGSGDKVVPFFCKNCGYIELYKKKELTDFFDRIQRRNKKP